MNPHTPARHDHETLIDAAPLPAGSHPQRARTTRTPAACLAALFAALLTILCAAPPQASAGAYRDPITGSPRPSMVTRAFDPPAQDWLPGHRGVDLFAAPGQPITAAGSGTVNFAGVIAGTPTVSIDHPDGIRTTYQPVLARVRAGDTVTVGQVIGILSTPTDGHPGLSWGAKWAERKADYINPLSLLDSPVIRLKPVGEPADRPGANAPH